MALLTIENIILDWPDYLRLTERAKRQSEARTVAQEMLVHLDPEIRRHFLAEYPWLAEGE
jgi:hypothetical protein